MMTNTIRFYDSKLNDLLSFHSVTLDLPSSIEQIKPSKENNSFIINSVKSLIINILPRELEDPKRIDLLKILKAVHEHTFDVIDSEGNIVYRGQPKEENNTSEAIDLSDHDGTMGFLSLQDLLVKKELLEAQLREVSQTLDLTVKNAWEIIDNRLTQLKLIQEQWRDLKANTLGSKNLKVLAQISEELKDISSLDEGSNLLS